MGVLVRNIVDCAFAEETEPLGDRGRDVGGVVVAKSCEVVLVRNGRLCTDPVGDCISRGCAVMGIRMGALIAESGGDFSRRGSSLIEVM